MVTDASKMAAESNEHDVAITAKLEYEKMFGVLKANFDTVYDLAYDFHQEHVATYQQYAGCADFVFYIPGAVVQEQV